MDNIKIQKMNKSHIDKVYKISKQSFSLPWSKDELIKEVSRDAAVNLVALLNNELVGFIQSWYFIEESDIINIAVDEKYRNKGIGKLLLLSLFKKLKEINVETVFLEVRISNLNAEKLYKSVGFKILYIRDNYYIDGEDAFLMVLDIKNKNFN